MSMIVFIRSRLGLLSGSIDADGLIERETGETGEIFSPSRHR